MPARKLSGFTLVELLVVMAIIGMLIGLLIVALSGSIVMTNRTVSEHNLKELAKAISIYESSKQRYPGYLQRMRQTQNPPLDPPLDASWVVAIFPYIGRNDLYDTWFNPAAGNMPNEWIMIPLLQCPGDDFPNAGGPRLSYVANTGIADSADEGRQHGIFFDHRPKSPATALITMSSGDITRRDGLTSTLLLGENTRAHTWSGRVDCNSPAAYPGTSVPDTTCPHAEYMLGFVWGQGAVPGTQDRPVNQLNADGSLASGVAQEIRHARLNSPHPGGASVVFADGHTQFLADTISLETYNKLCTPDGTSIAPPQVPLDSAEYVR